jgi:hypothetical protein
MYTNIPAVGESKDSHIVITRKGEAVVKPRWYGDRIPVFKDSLDENSIDELLISLGAVNPQNTTIHPHESLQYQSYLVHYQCLYLQSN